MKELKVSVMSLLFCLLPGPGDGLSCLQGNKKGFGNGSRTSTFPLTTCPAKGDYVCYRMDKQYKSSHFPCM